MEEFWYTMVNQNSSIDTSDEILHRQRFRTKINKFKLVIDMYGKTMVTSMQSRNNT